MDVSIVIPLYNESESLIELNEWINKSFISSGFWLYFTSKPKNNARFFSRWFHTAGVWAVVYDAIYLVLVNVLMNMLIGIV